MGNTQSTPGQDQAGNNIQAVLNNSSATDLATTPSVSRRSAMSTALHRRLSSRPSSSPADEMELDQSEYEHNHNHDHGHNHTHDHDQDQYHDHGHDQGHEQDQDRDQDQDESPLVHEGIQATQEDTSMTTSTQAISISRSLSTVSRLGSRFMPDAVRNTLWNSGEETEHEGHALRNGASARLRSSTPPRQRQRQRPRPRPRPRVRPGTRQAHGHSHSQSSPRMSLSLASSASSLSFMSSLRRRIGHRLESSSSNISSDPRRRFVRGRPYSVRAAHELLRHDTEPEPEMEVDAETEMETEPPPVPGRSHASTSLASLRRVRLSLASPFTSLLGHASPASRSSPLPPHTPNPPHPLAPAADSDRLLPPLNTPNPPRTPDHGIELDEPLHELDATEAETGNVLTQPSTLTTGMSTVRRFPPTLRSRSTRLVRRAEYPPLSQVLQLAAAAIAAQLSGHANSGSGTGTGTGSGTGTNTGNGPGPSTGRPLAGDVFDGSIQNFVQTLQEAASAQAGENLDVNTPEGELPPVNFMRVFQFPNDDLGAPMSPSSSISSPQPSPPSASSPPTPATTHDPDRSVTLVLVGVRSMPAGTDAATSENGTIGPSLDNLLSLPFLPHSNDLGPAASGALFRRHGLRNRPHSRPHSMTNFSFPAQYESQRHQRRTTPTTNTTTGTTNVANSSTGNANTTTNTATTTATTTTPLSESPPGPNPPPSTPADIRSGAATPIRRPSSASAVQASALPDLDEDQDHAEVWPSHAPSLSPDLDFNVARQRRRSDSEFARRPELGSGASRRNGMVEPDAMSSSSSSATGRSWLIYVVGTNLSPDHPAFTMPSLFTDNPSYEDMQMLSTLLGPVKPPVASRDDIAQAGGIFRLAVHAHEDGLVAEPVDADGPIIFIKTGERCLICLGDYATDEEVRQLGRCHHVFHRECIDEWLTTGRNSCPMCRAQGVAEKNPTASTARPPPAASGNSTTGTATPHSDTPPWP